MLRFKYRGNISPVIVKGKGEVRQGDIVEFNENDVSKLSEENWEQMSMESFKKEVKKFPKGKKVFIKK